MKNNAIINAIKPAAVDLEEDEIANNNQEIETQEWLQEQTKTRTTAVMPTKFEERANGCYFQTNTPPLEQKDKLPAGTYTVSITPFGEMFLQQIEDYELGKIYGNVEKQAERIMSTFKARPAGTGLMLSGEKGCGKTMLAKLLSIKLIKEGVPTIVINRPLCGESFNKFIQNIEQPAVVVFDEFEKVYNKDQQNAMLTLLDGVYPTKKLFILTTNDRWAISEHMRNRPGRLFYHLEYKGLEEQFVIDYCEDNLKNKANLQGVVNLIELFEHFNFDMLKAIVEEMNRYDETAKEALAMMNIAAESWSQRFDVKLFKDDKQVPLVKDYETLFIDPSNEFNVRWWSRGVPNKDTMKPEELVHTTHGQESVHFEEEDIVSIKKGVYTFTNEDGFTVVLTKKPYASVSYSNVAML